MPRGHPSLLLRVKPLAANDLEQLGRSAAVSADVRHDAIQDARLQCLTTLGMRLKLTTHGMLPVRRCFGERRGESNLFPVGQTLTRSRSWAVPAHASRGELPPRVGNTLLRVTSESRLELRKQGKLLRRRQRSPPLHSQIEVPRTRLRCQVLKATRTTPTPSATNAHSLT